MIWEKLPIKGECHIEPDDYRLMLSAPQLAEENAKLREVLANLLKGAEWTLKAMPDIPEQSAFREDVAAARAILNQTAERL